MAEFNENDLAKIVAEKVRTRFYATGLNIISGLEVLLPQKYSSEELKKWNVNILTPCLDSYVEQSRGRPDIDVLFIAEEAIPKVCGEIIEQTIDRLGQSYPLKDFTFKLYFSNCPKRIKNLKGIHEYRICIEKKSDLEIEGIESLLEDLHIVLEIHHGNIEMIPELARTVAAKGCHKMSSRFVRLSEWNLKDSSQYLEMLHKLYEEYKRGNWWFYLFDQFLLDARYEGMNWGCAAGRDKACLLPNGIQVPCFRFLEKPELVDMFRMGDASRAFSNVDTRCKFSQQELPEQECASCEINRFCYGGCYMDRNRNNENQFGRNELFCEIMKNQIRFIDEKNTVGGKIAFQTPSSC